MLYPDLIEHNVQILILKGETLLLLFFFVWCASAMHFEVILHTDAFIFT